MVNNISLNIHLDTPSIGLLEKAETHTVHHFNPTLICNFSVCVVYYNYLQCIITLSLYPTYLHRKYLPSILILLFPFLLPPAFKSL